MAQNWGQLTGIMAAQDIFAKFAACEEFLKADTDEQQFNPGEFIRDFLNADYGTQKPN